MKKILKQAAAVLAALILTVTWCPLTSPAASTYTVTFRAGNAGSFDVEKVETAVKMKSLYDWILGIKKEVPHFVYGENYDDNEMM